MTISTRLLEMLARVADALGDELSERLVFVGGCTTALFITDQVVVEKVRYTDDVDLIVDLVGYAEWNTLQEALRAKGFTTSQEDEVICRMRLKDLKVDFMPADERILGFSNRWYKRGIETAEISDLPEGRRILRLTPPLFIATKLEAWLGRGKGDLFGSKDLEDIVLVVDGRPEIVDEVEAADEELRHYIAKQITALLDTPQFEDFLDGNVLGPPGRAEIVAKRLQRLAGNAA